MYFYRRYVFRLSKIGDIFSRYLDKISACAERCSFTLNEQFFFCGRCVNQSVDAMQGINLQSLQYLTKSALALGETRNVPDIFYLVVPEIYRT